MSIASASIQLTLENALKAFLATALPGETIHAAHAADKVTAQTYLAIIAGLPDWETFGGINAVVPVTFQVVTSLADGDERAESAAAHQTTLGAVFNLFTDQNHRATLAALNGNGSASLGFTGWESLPESHEDGKAEDNKAFAPVLRFIFEVFTRDI